MFLGLLQIVLTACIYRLPGLFTPTRVQATPSTRRYRRNRSRSEREEVSVELAVLSETTPTTPGTPEEVFIHQQPAVTQPRASRRSSITLLSPQLSVLPNPQNIQQDTLSEVVVDRLTSVSDISGVTGSPSRPATLCFGSPPNIPLPPLPVTSTPQNSCYELEGEGVSSDYCDMGEVVSGTSQGAQN